MAEVRDKSEERVRRLVTENLNALWRMLRRLGVPAASADDAVQQVFLVLIDRLHDIAPGSERAFLFGTALRVASRARKQSFARELGYQALDVVPHDPAPLPDELTHQKRARETLDRLLASMPEELRVVLVLYELEGLTTREIGHAVGIPMGTVASRLRRARELFESMTPDQTPSDEGER